MFILLLLFLTYKRICIGKELNQAVQHLGKYRREGGEVERREKSEAGIVEKVKDKEGYEGCEVGLKCQERAGRRITYLALMIMK